METLFINRYWLKEEKAQSDHSIIYQATDSETGNEVALKKLKTPSLLLTIQKEDAIRSFLTEIEERNRFSHPGVVELYTCFEHENEIYLAEEMVEGRNLAYYMRNGSYTVDLMTGALIFQRCAEAVHHAHKHEYFHRNLKPENILITGDNTVKVSDFMVCSFLSREQQVRSILDTDRFENLSPYSSPETTEGKPLTGRSNIFSLGVIMYEFFTGVRPFTGHNDEEMYEKILLHEPHQASILNPRIPPVLNYIIDKCLKKDPDERYATFRDFLDDMKYLYSEEKDLKTTLHLQATKKMKRTFLAARENFLKTLSKYKKQLVSHTAKLARTLKNDRPAGLFMDDPLESVSIARKKITSERGPLTEDAAEQYTIDPPSGYESSSPLFTRRITFLEAHRKALLPAGIILSLLLCAGILYCCYLYGQAQGNRPTAPSAIVLKTNGSSDIYVLCTISAASIEVRNMKGKGDTVKGTLDMNGRWQVQGLAAGTYLITVDKEGYSSYVSTVSLGEGEKKTLNIELKKGNPSLDIVTDPPGASIFVNDRNMGVSPLKTFELKPGSYALAAKYDGYKPYSEKISILSNEVLVRKITLEKESATEKPVAIKPGFAPPSPSPSPSTSPHAASPAKLRIESIPDVATVFVNSKEMGTTPFSWSGEASKVEIMVKKKGYTDWKDQVALAPGESKNILAELGGGPAPPPRPARSPGMVSPPRGKSNFALKWETHYSRSSTWNTLRGEEVVVEFSRDQIDSYLRNLASQQMAEHKDRGGNYNLDVTFSLEAGTRIVATFILVDLEKHATILEHTDREYCPCEPDSFMYLNERNNYTREIHIARSGPTTAAITILGRNASRIRSLLAGAPR
jgi:serine/threonine protein kinase